MCCLVCVQCVLGVAASVDPPPPTHCRRKPRWGGSPGRPPHHATDEPLLCRGRVTLPLHEVWSSEARSTSSSLEHVRAGGRRWIGLRRYIHDWAVFWSGPGNRPSADSRARRWRFPGKSTSLATCRLIRRMLADSSRMVYFAYLILLLVLAFLFVFVAEKASAKPVLSTVCARAASVCAYGCCFVMALGLLDLAFEFRGWLAVMAAIPIGILLLFIFGNMGH